MKYLIGLALLAGVVWYFVSEPFAAKVDQTYEENSTWNAKTITDDPEAYIYSAIQHLENLEDNLKDEEFRIKTRINQLTRESEETQTSIESLSDDINRWKNDYLILDGRKEGELRTTGYSKETLKDLITLAGGYTDSAYEIAGVLTRERAKLIEKEFLYNNLNEHGDYNTLNKIFHLV